MKTDISGYLRQSQDIEKMLPETESKQEKSPIQETLNLLTDADSRTDTIFEK